MQMTSQSGFEGVPFNRLYAHRGGDVYPLESQPAQSLPVSTLLC